MWVSVCLSWLEDISHWEHAFEWNNCPRDSLFLSFSFLVAMVWAVPVMLSVAMVFLVTMSSIPGVTILVLNHGNQEPKQVSPPLDSSYGIFHSNGNLTCTQIPINLPLCWRCCLFRCLHCCHRMPQMGETLKEQTFTFQSSEDLEVQDQGISRSGAWWRPPCYHVLWRGGVLYPHNIKAHEQKETFPLISSPLV